MRTKREHAGGEGIVVPEPAELERLAKEIADQIVAGRGSVVRWTSSIEDVEGWRRAARRAGRNLGVPVCVRA